MRPARYKASVAVSARRTFKKVEKFGQQAARNLVEDVALEIMQKAAPITPVDTGNLLIASTFIVATEGGENALGSKVDQVKPITEALRVKCSRPQMEAFSRVLFYVTNSKTVLAVAGYVAPYAHYVHDGTKRMGATRFLSIAVSMVKGRIPHIFKNSYSRTRWKARI